MALQEDQFTKRVRESLQAPARPIRWGRTLAVLIIAIGIVLAMVLIAPPLPTPTPCQPTAACGEF